MMSKEYEYTLKLTGTIRELSETLGISESTLYKMSYTDRLKTFEGVPSIEHVEEVEAPEFQSEYALYQGERIEMIGTLQEVMRKTGWTHNTAQWHTTPSARKRNRKVLMRLEEEEV